jgi:uncharacterized protein
MADHSGITAKKTWAVVGASNDTTKYGNIIWRFLKNKGCTVYPVNPNEKKIENDVCYPTVADLPEKPDVVNVIVPPKIAANVVQQCADAGIQHVWLQPGAESPEAEELGRKTGVKVISDACIMVEMRKGR